MRNISSVKCFQTFTVSVCVVKHNECQVTNSDFVCSNSKLQNVIVQITMKPLALPINVMFLHKKNK